MKIKCVFKKQIKLALKEDFYDLGICEKNRIQTANVHAEYV